MAWVDWLQDNWGDVAQTVGIMGSLALTTCSFRYQVKAQRMLGLLQITERHADLWKELLARPELGRVLKPAVDLSKKPVTEQERIFLRLLFLHSQSVMHAARAGVVIEAGRVARDFRDFLALPLPRAVWLELQPFLEPEFVELVEHARYGDGARPLRLLSALRSMFSFTRKTPGL